MQAGFCRGVRSWAFAGREGGCGVAGLMARCPVQLEDWPVKHRRLRSEDDQVSANILHPALQKAHVEMSFDDGRPGDAVRDAFCEVERLVRGLAGGAHDLPVELMQAAFAPVTGPLSDPAAAVRAQYETQRRFVDSFARYRPDREHAVGPDDELEAVEGVLVADVLARKLGGIAERMDRALSDVS